MINITKKQLMRSIKSRNSYDDYNPLCLRIVTDSRKVKKNDCYVAIKGENFDGHDFIEHAIDNGASLVISSKEVLRKEVLIVQDTVIALGQIALAYLNKFSLIKLAVTGSSGKTTTKDMLYSVLKEKYNTHRTIGNYNNEIGMPLTALDIDENVEAAIFEMGMSSLGEIDYLAAIVKPDISIITNIGTCHIENLKSKENIMKAKMEIANYLTQNNHLIVNGDDEFLMKLRKEDYNFTLLKYGFNDLCDIKAYNYRTNDNSSIFMVSGMGIHKEVTIPAIGKHNVSNALSTICVGVLLSIPIDDIQKGLLEFKPSKLRMQIHEHNNIRYINDSYNANPESMKAVIESISSYSSKRKIGILGDMLELGNYSKEAHENIAIVAEKNLDIVFFIGKEMKVAADLFLSLSSDSNRVYHYYDNSIVIDKIKGIIKDGDTILLKGSRGMKLDEICNGLINNGNMEVINE